MFVCGICKNSNYEKELYQATFTLVCGLDKPIQTKKKKDKHFSCGSFGLVEEYFYCDTHSERVHILLCVHRNETGYDKCKKCIAGVKANKELGG